MIKLIVTDLDGTLLNHEKKVSNYTVDILKKAKARGIDLCIATGRFVDDIKPEMEEYGLHPYFINMNGAEIREPNGNLIEEINIPDEKLEEIYNYFIENGLVPELYTNDGEYVINLTHEESKQELLRRMQFLFPHKKIELSEVEDNLRFKRRNYAKSIKELIDNNIKVRKIIGFTADSDLINKVKRHFNSFDDLVCVSALTTNFEITHIEAQKGPALKKLIKDIGIKADEVMIFGDGENDLSMFELFDNAVAMKNSMQLILDKARYVCDSNINDGVAKYIEKEIL